MRYATETIGTNAGIVWNALEKNKEQSLSALEKATKLKKEDLLLALGWLFKEGKVNCETVGKTIKISLI